MAKSAFENIAVIVQCRLSSTRLPQKALKDLGGAECVSRTLDAMKKVKAARYFFACDYDSQSALEPVAQKCGWEIFAGDRDDVLDRFCSLIEERFPQCDLIVRATGDNPFLFYEAAELSIKEFQEKYFDADYFTFSGLPHGSGVELFKASSILSAKKNSPTAYEREHVGPALYLHKERYKCVFADAPKEFYAPDLRTTVDTYADYKRALRLFDFLSGGVNSASPKNEPPFSAAKILSALGDARLQKTLLLVPSVKAGRGTGHLRRALALAKDLSAFVYLPQNATLEQAAALVQEARSNGLKDWQIIDGSLENVGGGWDLIVLDLFRSTKEEAALWQKLGPVCALDDGGSFCAGFDYLLDIIPSMPRKPQTPALSENYFSPALLDLPKNRRASFPSAIKNALVCVSGETRGSFSAAAVQALESLGAATTEVSSKNPVANLRERLFQYDLVVTHYGLTAFEAAAANCAVITVATSPLHKKLSKRYGFVCLDKKDLTAKKIARFLKDPAAMRPGLAGRLGLEENSAQAQKTAPLGLAIDLVQGQEAARNSGLATDSSIVTVSSPAAAFVQTLMGAQKFSCPVCGGQSGGASLGLAKSPASDPVVARTRAHTFRRCSKCGMLYLAFSTDSRVQYETDYFGSEYKAQYGRTYLDDFDSIKAQGLRRAAEIRALLGRGKPSSLLDIGCAYGPFLAAAKDEDFEPYGTDISQSALSYVKDTLGFPCVLSSFAAFDSQKVFGVQKFDAATMWYVIEHCSDLDALLRRVNALLKDGGIFAFSTPSASGLSGRFNRRKFFEQSPRDHYTIWEPKRAGKILLSYGFKVKKIVSTGIHPERAAFLKKLSRGALTFRFLSVFCKLFALGDTFEIYCEKIGELR